MDADRALTVPRFPGCRGAVTIPRKEATMIELTEMQRQELKGSGPVRARNPETNEIYVLIRSDVYERLRGLLEDDLLDAASLMNQVMVEDDANDPYLESYQH